MPTTSELWESIVEKTCDIKVVLVKDTIRAYVATIRRNGKLNEYWVGEYDSNMKITAVKRICEY